MREFWIRVIFPGTGQVVEEGHHLSYSVVSGIADSVVKRGHVVEIGVESLAAQARGCVISAVG